MSESKNTEWLKSKDAMKALKVSSCHLAHLRIDGKLGFKKEGNAFLYDKDGVLKLKST